MSAFVQPKVRGWLGLGSATWALIGAKSLQSPGTTLTTGLRIGPMISSVFVLHCLSVTHCTHGTTHTRWTPPRLQNEGSSHACPIHTATAELGAMPSSVVGL